MPLSVRISIAIRRSLPMSCPALRSRAGRLRGPTTTMATTPSTTISPNDIPNTVVTLARGGPTAKAILRPEGACWGGIFGYSGTRHGASVCPDQRLHFGKEASFDGKLRKLTMQAPRLTRAFVDRMNDVVHPDLVVNLGDDIEDENRETDLLRYRECMGELSRCKSEVRHVAGNHDLINLTEGDLL